MIEFEFQLDKQILKDDLLVDPGTANAAALQETYFEMPVRLSIDGIEMFEADGITISPWLPLPLLDVARVATEVVYTLADDTEGTYWLPGGGWSLKMKRTGSDVEIESTVNGRRAVVPYSELKASVVMFRERVRRTLKEHVPELRSHETWGPWMEGNV